VSAAVSNQATNFANQGNSHQKHGCQQHNPCVRSGDIGPAHPPDRHEPRHSKHQLASGCILALTSLPQPSALLITPVHCGGFCSGLTAQGASRRAEGPCSRSPWSSRAGRALLQPDPCSSAAGEVPGGKTFWVTCDWLKAAGLKWRGEEGLPCSWGRTLWDETQCSTTHPGTSNHQVTPLAQPAQGWGSSRARPLCTQAWPLARWSCQQSTTGLFGRRQSTLAGSA